MPWIVFLCILLHSVFGEKTSDKTHTIQPKDITNAVEANLKDIPSSEISKHALPGDDKDKIVVSEKKINLPEIIEIKPLGNTFKSGSVKAKPTYKNKRKGKKWRSKMGRKQKNALKKRNKLRWKLLRQQQLKRKKQMQKKNKMANKGKKQLRNIQTNRLSEVINHILSQHKKGESSKLSSQHIRQQILDLMNSHKDDRKVIKPGKACPTPKIGRRKDRKRLRSLNRNRAQKNRPRKRVVFRARQRVRVSRGKGKGKDGSKKNILNKDKPLKTYITKGKKGKFRSKVTVSIGNKKKSRRNRKNRKKSSARKGSKEN